MHYLEGSAITLIPTVTVVLRHPGHLRQANISRTPGVAGRKEKLCQGEGWWRKGVTLGCRSKVPVVAPSQPLRDSRDRGSVWQLRPMALRDRDCDTYATTLILDSWPKQFIEPRHTAAAELFPLWQRPTRNSLCLTNDSRRGCILATKRKKTKNFKLQM
ncbi:hypothetical protein E2C01_031947 [Portunus trituberculatus]|uniref:Uncharacterized protein n=1 Tax=Portunus trituberculatus TaxID=210409 RepID=A0A5B7EU53_PORTR|nr:hypothetical protein [Portunus trituberculatus]